MKGTPEKLLPSGVRAEWIFRARLLIFAATLLLAGCSGIGSASEVSTWEQQVIIPTYPLRPDDLNPQLFELTGSNNYPYTTQDGFTSELVDRSYRVVYLENEYLRIMCLPEIGGRIHSVYDKVRDEEMFHVNQVIKPGHIALRGAWVSGGIEWNRGPQGHTVTSFSPVDVVGVQNPDGSASLVIGYTEMNFRTGWTVRLTLHPDRAYLDEQIEIFNPTDGSHPYYFWNNTAFPQRDGTRFIYPMTLGTDHDGVNFFSWPIHEGSDLSWLKNYPEPTSVFGYQVAADFFGAYDVDRDYGIVQVADHKVLPGKKAWTWGQSDEGMVAQSALTDDDGPYIEVQSGPLLTQADFEMLRPGGRVAWQEFWYPVGGLIDGFEYATPDMAVQRREAGSLGSWNMAAGIGEEPSAGVELRFLSTGVFPNARLVVRRGAEQIVSRTVDFNPRSVQVIPLSIAPGEAVSVSVESDAGASLLRYESPLAIPERTAPNLEHTPLQPTSAQMYLDALDLDKKSDRLGARRGYMALIESDSSMDPDTSAAAAMVSLAVLDAEAGRYERAKELLNEAQIIDPEEGMILYLRGVANLQLGDLDAALADGFAATEAVRPTPLGHGLVGRTHMRLRDFPEAITAFEAGLAVSDTDHVRLSESHMLATYKLGDIDGATLAAAEDVASGTVRLVPWAVAELVKGGSGEANLSDTDLTASAERFALSVGWVGETEFAHLELAFTLAELGLVEEAAAFTRAVLVDNQNSPRPLPLYTLAYFEHELGNTEGSQRLVVQASEIKADYVFPSRTEMIDVLQHAISEKPDDARAHLYLGNLYAGLGRFDEVEPKWRLAVEIDPSLSVAARNLGLLTWKLDGDLSVAASWYRAAISARPDDQTLYRDLARILIEQGDADAGIAVLESLPRDEYRRPDVVVLLADTYTVAKRFDDAIALLGSTTFTNREGVRDTWEIFSRAHIDRGINRYERAVAASSSDQAGSELQAALSDFDMALTYPANLNAGRPHEPLEARANYWRGLTFEILGDSERAQEAWEACAAGVRRGQQQQEHVRLCERKLQ
jgi:tetratricopeptide (TPR) repeat protein